MLYLFRLNTHGDWVMRCFASTTNLRSTATAAWVHKEPRARRVMAEIILTVDVIRHDNTKCDKRQGRMFAPTLTAVLETLFQLTGNSRLLVSVLTLPDSFL